MIFPSSGQVTIDSLAPQPSVPTSWIPQDSTTPAWSSPQKTLWAYIPNTASTKKISSMSIPGAVLLINIMLIIAFSIFAWTKMIQYAVSKDDTKVQFISAYRSTMQLVDRFTGYPGIAELQQNAQWWASEKTIDTILQSSVPFVFKRDLMESQVEKISSTIVQTSQELSAIQEEIAKYGFVHPEIMSVFMKTNDSIPIITLLKTLETVKFGTSLKIFSLLDTFLTQTSRSLGVDKEKLAEAMKEYSQRWEKDIDRFIMTCYLNPYEILPECKQIDDFANYFTYDEKESTTLDPLLFSKIVMIIDAKLEQSELPSIQLSFDRFSPKLSSLAFDVTVNTLPEDEAAFLKKWIINPHIFIISTLVNFLKQSMVVIGDSINVNKLNIQEKIYTIGDIQIPINTSSMKFNLPLQKASQREIYDYYQSK